MSSVNRQFFFGSDMVSARLDKMRRAKDMTWSDFADFIGVSRQYLSLLRVGARQPSRKLDKMLCDLEQEILRQNGNAELTLHEAVEPYDPKTMSRKLDVLAAENLGLKAQLKDIDEKLRQIMGGKSNERDGQ